MEELGGVRKICKNIGWFIWGIPVVWHIFSNFYNHNANNVRNPILVQNWLVGRQWPYKTNKIINVAPTHVVSWHPRCHIPALQLGHTKSHVSPRMGEIYQELYTAGTLYKCRNIHYNGFSTSINLVEPSSGFHKLQVLTWLSKNSHIFGCWRFLPKSC